jgi:quercetin dioxygenase-like cupin family protein
MRMLYVEPVSGIRPAMLHMAAGSEVPAHDHDEVEECFVADGRIRVGNEKFSAGDHLIAGAGTTHQSLVALTPATLPLHWNPAA